MKKKDKKKKRYRHSYDIQNRLWGNSNDVPRQTDSAQISICNLFKTIIAHAAILHIRLTSVSDLNTWFTVLTVTDANFAVYSDFFPCTVYNISIFMYFVLLDSCISFNVCALKIFFSIVIIEQKNINLLIFAFVLSLIVFHGTLGAGLWKVPCQVATCKQPCLTGHNSRNADTPYLVRSTYTENIVLLSPEASRCPRTLPVLLTPLNLYINVTVRWKLTTSPAPFNLVSDWQAGFPNLCFFFLSLQSIVLCSWYGLDVKQWY